MRIVRRGRLSTALVAVLFAATAGCWWQPGGNANRSGHHALDSAIGIDSLDSLEEVWTGPAVQVIVGGRGYATGGRRHAVDLATGEVLWQWPEDPTHDGERMFFDGRRLLDAGGAPRSGYFLSQVSGRDGVTVDGWHVEFQPEAVRGTTVAGQSRPDPSAPLVSTVDVLDLEDSGRNWRAVTSVGDDDPNLPHLTIGPADVFAAGTGLLSTDPTSVATGLSLRAYTLDSAPPPCATDGSGDFPITYACPRFSVPLPGTSASSPVLSDDLATVYVGTDAGVLHAVDVATGALAWTADVGSAVTATPAVADGMVLVPTDAGLVAVDAGGCGAGTCGAAWSSTGTAAVTVQPAAVGGAVFVGDATGTLSAFAIAGCGAGTCTSSWSTDLGSTFTGPIAIGSTHLIADVDRTAHAFAPT